MGKILSADVMQALLGDTDNITNGQAMDINPSADLEALVAPTANELMDLTQQALDELEPGLALDAEQQSALGDAFKNRLGEALRTPRDES